MEYEEDRLLWKNLKGGDRTSLNAIFVKYYDVLLTFANAYITLNDAEEVVADIFFLLWSKRDQIEINLSLKVYLYKATKNRCLNVIKQRKDHSKLLDKVVHYELQCNDIQPDEMMIYQQTKNQLDDLINKLPKQCRIIFLLSRNDGLSHLEISKILNISPNTVNTQVYRAIKYLKSRISFLDCTIM
ncbi:RNA polymerase sigma-70 factor [Aquimarina sp. ERC-38]|uniref:RNA polymerase sigma factor n=1 Tax=Aquimarina sp. ERC-38 TaxID=2949996 RepID=UPI00224690EB|nr:RNA polymerase sigma-70 factor [Aquimarina sp. ERC-38]UZO81314.1 RNA polymerase sigma-70 factor [Aquimarina sp. ERC-38]